MKSQSVRVEVDANVPLIYVESLLLSKVLTALLDNALKTYNEWDKSVTCMFFDS